MLKTSVSFRSALIISIALHVILSAFLFWKTHMTHYGNNSNQTTPIIHAVVVNTHKIDAAIQRLKAAQQKKRAMIQARTKREKREQLMRAKAARKHALAMMRAKRLRLEKKRKTLKLKKEHELALKKAQHLAEEKQLQEQALLNKQEALQKVLANQILAKERRQLMDFHEQQIAGVVDEYKTKIIEAIAQEWQLPNAEDLIAKHLFCILHIRLGPGGVVLSTIVERQSGDGVLDRSAVAAVFKASPLPIPKDPALFDHFRDLRLTVRPEQVL